MKQQAEYVNSREKVEGAVSSILHALQNDSAVHVRVRKHLASVFIDLFARNNNVSVRFKSDNTLVVFRHAGATYDNPRFAHDDTHVGATSGPELWVTWKNLLERSVHDNLRSVVTGMVSEFGRLRAIGTFESDAAICFLCELVEPFLNTAELVNFDRLPMLVDAWTSELVFDLSNYVPWMSKVMNAIDEYQAKLDDEEDRLDDISDAVEILSERLEQRRNEAALWAASYLQTDPSVVQVQALEIQLGRATSCAEVVLLVRQWLDSMGLGGMPVSVPAGTIGSPAVLLVFESPPATVVARAKQGYVDGAFDCPCIDRLRDFVNRFIEVPADSGLLHVDALPALCIGAYFMLPDIVQGCRISVPPWVHKLAEMWLHAMIRVLQSQRIIAFGKVAQGVIAAMNLQRDIQSAIHPGRARYLSHRADCYRSWLKAFTDGGLFRPKGDLNAEIDELTEAVRQLALQLTLPKRRSVPRGQRRLLPQVVLPAHAIQPSPVIRATSVLYSTIPVDLSSPSPSPYSPYSPFSPPVTSEVHSPGQRYFSASRRIAHLGPRCGCKASDADLRPGSAEEGGMECSAYYCRNIRQRLKENALRLPRALKYPSTMLGAATVQMLPQFLEPPVLPSFLEPPVLPSFLQEVSRVLTSQSVLRFRDQGEISELSDIQTCSAMIPTVDFSVLNGSKGFWFENSRSANISKILEADGVEWTAVAGAPVQTDDNHQLQCFENGSFFKVIGYRGSKALQCPRRCLIAYVQHKPRSSVPATVFRPPAPQLVIDENMEHRIREVLAQCVEIIGVFCEDDRTNALEDRLKPLPKQISVLVHECASATLEHAQSLIDGCNFGIRTVVQPQLLHPQMGSASSFLAPQCRHNGSHVIGPRQPLLSATSRARAALIVGHNQRRS
eukprot:TRINITY_DN1064_c0_g1_i2.p1 TRINITY_DN1064_c0_g1~~TRINITY_DN1064_c0_g1_i2.p1  ORF type:complete len:895 (+),score=97.98 TRINITY_DN1064_c0_g1_i2:1438-4122(+)